MKRNISLTLVALTLSAAATSAFADSRAYVSAGPTGGEFINQLPNWKPGQKWCDDDNFFISRVRPKQRFRNRATQINETLNKNNDKNLVYWVPIGTPPNNAVPIGDFDGDNFNMWQYVTHYGNWNAGLMRCPGNFTDVAHKNGVGVSTIISTPYGTLGEGWANALTAMINTGAEKYAQYMKYYGIDGLGYNSEFQYPSKMYDGISTSLVKDLANFNADLMRLSGNEAPYYANIWYDGTDINGNISFDQGLEEHNFDTFGRGDNPATALFLNYNWNRLDLDRMVSNARAIGRDPLDIYCGFNMQGKQPSPANPVWTLIKDRPLSIGLWGAHSQNIMFEGRNEKGTSADARQNTYLKRNEYFFSGGTRNPVTTPEVEDMWGCGADNTSFFGMSKLMTARSSLSWNLDNEPFITFFNLGNGKFFNWMGQRTDNRGWTNIGVQDYLPTWRFWFARKFLGKKPTDVSKYGLEANFVWSDGYVGGSLLKIQGTTQTEYLHLFKTRFELKADDEISITFRVLGGKSQMRLVCSAEGDEATAIESPQIIDYTHLDRQWTTATFRVGDAFPALVGKNLAMIALKFDWADKLDLNIGRLSLSRPGAASATPATPILEKAEALAFSKAGVDAKIIYNMPNNVTDRVCYNDDVNTSLFKIWYQQEGEEAHLKTITTSWAALIYDADILPGKSRKVRFGVSALSIDMNSESEIAWSDYLDFNDLFVPSNDIQVSVKEPYAGEAFNVALLDPHSTQLFNWTITDSEGTVVGQSNMTSQIEMSEGLANAGSYSVAITDAEGNTRSFPGYIRVLDASVARAPEIVDLTVSTVGDHAQSRMESEAVEEVEEGDISINVPAIEVGDKIKYEYTSRPADGVRSRGVRLDAFGFGLKALDAGFSNKTPFSIAFWICPENETSYHVLSLRDKTNSWPRNEYGMLRQVYDPTTRTLSMNVIFKGIIEGNYTVVYENVDIPQNNWSHVGMSFGFNDRKLDFKLAVNGKVIPATRWNLDSLEGEGEPGTMGPTPWWTDYHTLAVGGNLHQLGGVQGYIDHFQYYDAALSAEQLQECYTHAAPYEADGALKLYYSLDNDVNQENGFASDFKSDNTACAGLIEYVAGFAEGTGNARFAAPEFGPGLPAATSKREVKTEAIWDIPAFEVATQQTELQSGFVEGAFTLPGSFVARLTLTNDCGSDSREYVFLRVNEGVYVHGVCEEREGLPVYRFEGNQLLLWLNSDAGYTADIYNIDGKPMLRNQRLEKGSNPVVIPCDFSTGYYLLHLTSQDKTPVTMKLYKAK